MNLILLPGAGKTGSTFLQSFMYANKENLRNKGFSYPVHNHHSEGGNAEFIWYWLSRANSRNVSLIINEHIASSLASGCNTIVYSCEMLIDLAEYDHLQLREILQKSFTSIQCYVTLRNPVDWVVSAWLQALKRGSVLEFNEYVEIHASTQVDSAIRFANTFECKFLNYDVLKSDLKNNYLEAIGIDSGGLDNMAGLVKNRSLNAREALIYNQFNKLWADPSLTERFHALFSEFNINDNSPGFVADPASAHLIMEKNSVPVEYLRNNHSFQLIS